MKAALEPGRWAFLAPSGCLNVPRSMGKSLIHDPERAPLVRRAFEAYATRPIHERTAAGTGQNLGHHQSTRTTAHVTSGRQAAGATSCTAGVVDVPEYGVRAKRGDFEPLISEELFYRAQSVLSGRVPSTAPLPANSPGLSTPRVRSLRILRTRAHRQPVERPQRSITRSAASRRRGLSRI